jgi:hypothetical protein
MQDVQFLSDEWLAAMDGAARSRPVPDPDPLADVAVAIEQVVTDGPRWRLVVDHGSCAVAAGGEGEPDVRLTSDRETAEAVASGRRAALDAFIAGDLVLGGDVRALLENRAALEVLGDLFAQVKAETVFS